MEPESRELVFEDLKNNPPLRIVQQTISKDNKRLVLEIATSFDALGHLVWKQVSLN